MVVPIIDYIIAALSHIFNHSFVSSTFPSCWKGAPVFPLLKKSNKSDYSDFRLISILAFLSKVCRVHQQLISFFSLNNLLNPFQSSFWGGGHSTVIVLVKISDVIRHAMDDQKLTVLTLLDFSNAIDTVDFAKLLSVLVSFNISPTIIDWFQSYLYGHRQRLIVQDTFSDWGNVFGGVSQGGV